MAPAYEALEQGQEVPGEPRPAWKEWLGKLFASWWTTLAIFGVLLALILLAMWLLVPRPDGAEKVGAGMLFVRDKQVLLLLRNSRHNDHTWGLPGGNAEPHDASLLATATREATEELGSLPNYDVLAEIPTKRGKRQQKHYTVVVANVTDAEWQPQLNEEHHTFQWVDISTAAGWKDLHPVVALLLRTEGLRQQLAVALLAGGSGGGLADAKPKKLGAGLLLLAAGGDVLLLTRNSSHNNATLSVPGGNADLDDSHLLETATREAREEMGGCPQYELKGEVDTRRGHQGQKVFKVFLGRVTDNSRSDFVPVLSKESLAWGWYPLEGLPAREDLHPVVQLLVRQHMEDIEKAFGIAPSSGSAAQG